MEPTGPAFGGPDDRLRDIGGLPINIRSAVARVERQRNPGTASRWGEGWSRISLSLSSGPPKAGPVGSIRAAGLTLLFESAPPPDPSSAAPG